MIVFKKYTIFANVQIDIDSALVSSYEENVAPFDDRRAEYLAVTSGCDETTDAKTIGQKVAKAIGEEVSVYKDKETIATKAKNSGVF